MRLRLAIALGLVICVVSLSACANPLVGILGGSGGGATPTAQPTSRLSGSSWILTQLHANGKSQTLVPTAPITLQFQQSDSSYIGSSGCNYYNGAYVSSGNHLSLKFKSVTQVACVGPIMSQEVTFLNMLQQVRSYELSGHTLLLKNGADEVILVFTAA